MSYKKIVAAIGKYEKDGKVKYVNRTIGKLVDTQYGQKIVIDRCYLPGFICEDDGSVWCSLFDPEPKVSGKDLASEQKSGGFNEDDIPWL